VIRRAWCDDIDEGDVRHDGFEEVGAQIRHRAHEEAAGTAALDRHRSLPVNFSAIRNSATAMKS